MRDVDKDLPSASAWCFWKWFDGGEVCVVFIERISVGALILQYSTWFANVQISHIVFFGKKIGLYLSSSTKIKYKSEEIL